MVTLEAKGVRVAYRSRAVLDGASLTLRGGEILALLGPNGAGKTTLARAMHLLVEPDEGNVLLDGKPVADRSAAIRTFGLVQQRPGLLRGTVRANVEFPLRARGLPLAKAVEALARVGLSSLAHASVSGLSGGEAQRAAIARALAPSPAVLFLDEFTNQLDPDAEDAMEALAREERARGAAILLVTHSLAQARRIADRVAFLDQGRVVEEGVTSNVLDNPRTALVRRYVARA